MVTANDDWDDYFPPSKTTSTSSSSSSSSSNTNVPNERIVILCTGWGGLSALRKCAGPNKALECVSIRNAKWGSNNVTAVNRNLNEVPQNAPIKFVRSVPSLRWFRSDLTQENMSMLQLERPEIELLN
jgi:hypothetical protein